MSINSLYYTISKTQLIHLCCTTVLALLLLTASSKASFAATQKSPANAEYANVKLIPPLTIVTEHLPPLQIVENNVAISGMSVEIVKQLLEITKEDAIIQGHSWARAYKMATEQANVMIFSITRNHIRENKFHWVGMIDKLDSHLWRLKSRTDITISSLENAKNYSVAVPKGDIQHQILLDNGFKESEKMVVVSRYSQALKMLLIGRVDLIIGNSRVLKDKLSPLGHNFKQIHPVIEIRNNIGDIYIAFSLNTPIEQVEKYRKALKLLKHKGIVQRIIDKY